MRRLLSAAGGRREALAPVLVTAIVALAYRLLYLHQLGGSPAFLVPILDGAMHLEWARGLVSGSWPGSEPFFRAPGYIVALAGPALVTGADPAALATLQLVLGAVTPALVARLGWRIAGSAGAWIAGLGAAVYPMFPFFDGQLLVPVLAVPLAVLAVLASLSALDEPRPGRVAVAGLLWGVAAIVRPPLLVAGALLPVFLFAGAASARRSTGNVRRAGGARAAIVALVCLLVAPLLVTARNAATGDAVFIASQGGLNFYLGNGENANGMSATFADSPTDLGYRMVDAAARLAEEREGRALRASEVSRHYVGRAWNDIREQPGRWFALLLKKAILFGSVREIPNNHDPVLFAERIGALRWTPGWGFWAPLAILGIVAGGVRWAGGARRDLLFVTVVVAAIALTAVLFFVNARFRIPAVPFVIVLGAVGGLELARHVRARDLRRTGVAVAILVAGALFVRWNPYGVPREVWVVSYVLVAEAESIRGEPGRALRWIERGLERQPNLYAARIAQLDLLRRAGQVGQARDIAVRCLEGLPHDARLRSEHGVLLDLSGDPQGALEELGRAIALDPSYHPAHVHRAIVLSHLGRPDDAQEALRVFLETFPSSSEGPRARAILASLAAPGD